MSTTKENRDRKTIHYPDRQYIGSAKISFKIFLDFFLSWQVHLLEFFRGFQNFQKTHCIRIIIQQQLLTCLNFFLDFWKLIFFYFGLKQLSDAAPADTCSRCQMQFLYFLFYWAKSQDFKLSNGPFAVMLSWTQTKLWQKKLKFSRFSQLLRIYLLCFIY